MSCRVEQHDRARRCATQLADVHTVHAVDILSPTDSPLNRWTVEVMLRADSGGVRPPILSCLAQHDLTVRNVVSQGPRYVAVAVA
jgi:hypothetical protein